MLERSLVAIVLLALAATSAADDDMLESFATLMQGRFEIDEPDNRMVDERIRVDAPAIGDVVFYMQLRQGPELAVYRQRILVFEAEDAAIYQRAYSLHEPERWVDASADQLSGLGADDIKPTLPDGCDQVWIVVDQGFRGYTDPRQCTVISSRTGKPRSIEAKTLLTGSMLSLVERGFDEQGNQLFGTKPGEALVLRRVSD